MVDLGLGDAGIAHTQHVEGATGNKVQDQIQQHRDEQQQNQ
jgi:hypothetical protein